MATTGISLREYLGFDGSADDWNWREDFVQLDENLGTSGDFIAAESTLIACGLPKATDAMSVVKLGLTPQIQISQNIPQQRLYEIGSMRCHIINGIPVGGFSISRMIYNGPSLVRAFYGVMFDDDGNPTEAALSGLTTRDNNVQSTLSGNWSNITRRPDKTMDGNANQHLWLSLWDTRLRMPFGLAVFMQDIKGIAAGGFYLEGCKVNSHSTGTSAGQMIMMEGINCAFDRMVPIVSGVGKS